MLRLPVPQCALRVSRCRVNEIPTCPHSTSLIAILVETPIALRVSRFAKPDISHFAFRSPFATAGLSHFAFRISRFAKPGISHFAFRETGHFAFRASDTTPPTPGHYGTRHSLRVSRAGNAAPVVPCGAALAAPGATVGGDVSKCLLNTSSVLAGEQASTAWQVAQVDAALTDIDAVVGERTSVRIGQHASCVGAPPEKGGQNREARRAHPLRMARTCRWLC